MLSQGLGKWASWGHGGESHPYMSVEICGGKVKVGPIISKT